MESANLESGKLFPQSGMILDEGEPARGFPFYWAFRFTKDESNSLGSWRKHRSARSGQSIAVGKASDGIGRWRSRAGGVGGQRSLLRAAPTEATEKFQISQGNSRGKYYFKAYWKYRIPTPGFQSNAAIWAGQWAQRRNWVHPAFGTFRPSANPQPAQAWLKTVTTLE